MAVNAKPYSPETLADRWGCSAEKIRQMYRSGELACFKLGKLIRISAAEVERYECQNIALERTGESTSSSTAQTDSLFDARLARLTGGSQNLALVQSGKQSMPLPANG